LDELASFIAITLLIISLLFLVSVPIIIAYNYLSWLIDSLFPPKMDNKKRQILSNNCSFYNKLSSDDKEIFESRVLIFLKDISFSSKKAILNNEVKLTVVGVAISLTFGFKDWGYSRLNRIIIYPSTYYSKITKNKHKGEYNPGFKLIVFSWKDFKHGIRYESDNLNLGLHEFTHALYFSFLKSDSNDACRFIENFEQIIVYLKNENLKKQLLEANYFRDYAFKNKYEFIAVLIEHFFETPSVFKDKFPSMYEIMVRMLNQNPLQLK
tara:strand:+ start:168 stop:968 length:801 start_codon:yes stop_codon:yes gene_type:complete